MRLPSGSATSAVVIAETAPSTDTCQSATARVSTATSARPPVATPEPIWPRAYANHSLRKSLRQSVVSTGRP